MASNTKGLFCRGLGITSEGTNGLFARGFQNASAPAITGSPDQARRRRIGFLMRCVIFLPLLLFR